jgi:hypothetical protein
VGNQDDRGALLAGSGGQQVHHQLPGHRVQRPGRLVGEQHLRAGDQAPGQRDPLRLPAGQLPGPAVLQAVQAQPGEPVSRLGHRRSPPGTGQQQRQRDVLLGGQLGDELTGLEHEPEPVPAQLAAPVISQGVQPLPAEPDLPLVGNQDAGQAVQQRRLARPARPHDREDLTPAHDHAGAAQRRRLAEGLHDIPGLDSHPLAGGRLAAGHRHTARASTSSRAAV